jgi:3-oxoacyl-[acyl-carrier-protein] synthase-1
VRFAPALTHFVVCNALGRSSERVRERLFAGASGLERERPFPSRCRSSFETFLGRTDIDPGDVWLEQGPARRQEALWLLGAEKIIEAARSTVARRGAHRVAVLLGTSTGGIEATERAFAMLVATGSLPADYSFDRHHAFDAGARSIAAQVGARGPVYAISTACSSSAKALAAGRRLLAADLADAALVLGVDSLCLLTLLGFHGLGVVDPAGCRPFAEQRHGMTVGEGAAAVLLERDVPGDVFLVGTGESSDAHHMAHPHPEGVGAKLAIERALADAGIEPREVDYVNAHGTGTIANDVVEARVLAGQFGRRPFVSSTKTHTGHLLGASGATEAVFSAWAIQSGLVPGNGSHPISADLGIAVPELATARRVDFALSNSFAFGGSNAALLLASETGRARTAGAGRGRAVEWLSVRSICSATDQLDAETKSLLSPRVLGRASPLTRIFAKLLSRCAEGGARVTEIPLVFASAFGEMTTTLELLRLQAEKGESSPLRFQSSVHNAAQGQLSIATGHQGFATSISAGTDTVAMALMEATGLVGDGHDEVLVLIAEESPATELSPGRYPELGIALHLSFSTEPAGPRITPPHRATVPRTEFARFAAGPPFEGNPVADSERLRMAIAQAVPARVPLGVAPGSTTAEVWCVEHHPATG